jgi:hypothetical protein
MKPSRFRDLAGLVIRNWSIVTGNERMRRAASWYAALAIAAETPMSATSPRSLNRNLHFGS